MAGLRILLTLPPSINGMLSAFKTIYHYRELLQVLAWKNITLRYKQSHLGLVWLVLRPIVMVAIFMVVRSFVGIDSGRVPYALLTYCAMVPWVFFQEAATDGVGSVTNHAHLVKKIYFPREVLPLASLAAAALQLGIGLFMLAAMMLWYRWAPTWHVLWVPALTAYVMLAALALSLFGAAVNVYSRDASSAMPLLIGMAMYLSPVMYPLELVRKALVDNQAAGAFSHSIYWLYLVNPMAGVIDGFQRTLLLGQPPDPMVMMPGMLVVALALPFSFAFFKRAESWFADVI
jgi:lipopolysaccharide transport system permease protein